MDPNETSTDTPKFGAADREPTPDEAARAEELEVDPDVAEHYEEAIEQGAAQEGEGRITP